MAYTTICKCAYSRFRAYLKQPDKVITKIFYNKVAELCIDFTMDFFIIIIVTEDSPYFL